LDVLLAVNYICANGIGTLPDQRDADQPYCDVNGDGLVSAGDVLLLINFINNQTVGASEGEAASESFEKSNNQTVPGNEAAIDERRLAESASGYAFVSSRSDVSSPFLPLSEQSQYERNESEPADSRLSDLKHGVPSSEPENTGQETLSFRKTSCPNDNDLDLEKWDDLLTEIARDVSDFLTTDVEDR